MSASAAPFRKVKLGPRDTKVEHRADGSILLRSPHPLSPYPEKITERLVHWAKAAPARLFMAQRGPDGAWRKLSYAATLDKVRGIAQALLNRNLSIERPIAILCENNLEHALLALAARAIPDLALAACAAGVVAAVAASDWLAPAGPHAPEGLTSP